MSFIVRPWHMGGGWRQCIILLNKRKRYCKTKTFDINTFCMTNQTSVKRFRSRFLLFFAFPLTTQNSNQKNFSRSQMNCHELCGNCYHIVYWGQFDFRGPKTLWFMRKNLGIYYGYYRWLWVVDFWFHCG
jgi:hypothetical protein